MDTKYIEVRCPYCGQEAELKNTRDLGHKYSRPIWLCQPCDAYVGVHKGTSRPLGKLANKPLRAWRRSAHAVFDPIWKAKAASAGMARNKARKQAYAWLSRSLGIPRKDCHIALFGIHNCRRVFKLCLPYAKVIAKKKNRQVA